MKIRQQKGGICFPLGFSANGVSAGIKPNNRKDLALIYSKTKATAVGLFTTNRFQSESILVSKQNLKDGFAQAIVVISGNANCANGKRGIDDAKFICKEVARRLKIKESDVLIASTGKIGIPLPIKKIKQKIPSLVEGLSPYKGDLCSQTIITTDTYPKQLSFSINGKVRIGGMAKGAGMISPHLATMLCFVTTDALINKKLLNKIVKEAVLNSFHHISVDGEQSTNDTIFVMANGESQIEIKQNTNLYNLFSRAVKELFYRLSQLIIADGEGNSCVIKIEVINAIDDKMAEKIARRLAGSPLLKSSFYGRSPNWGRIISAIGSLDLRINKGFDVYYDKIKVISNGVSLYKKDRMVSDYLRKKKNFNIKVDLKMGKGNYWIYTTDLTPKYVILNKS